MFSRSKLIFFSSAAALSIVSGLSAQTNLQVLYDFGADRGHITTTFEGFYSDRWGSTFFFIDHDFNSRDNKDHVYAPSGTYMEVARCLNFWQKSALSPLSFHAEYNGGVYNGYTINNAWLFGLEYFLHSGDYKNTYNLQVLYKTIEKTGQDVPLQFTAVWTMNDLFGVKGLLFDGFADFWWETHNVYAYRDGSYDYSDSKVSKTVFISEPQLWYQVGRHFGVDNLSVGGEVEVSVDFGEGEGLWSRPCLGVRWVF